MNDFYKEWQSIKNNGLIDLEAFMLYMKGEIEAPLLVALNKIAGQFPLAESNKDKIHSEESGRIFAAASAWRMEIAKNALKKHKEDNG